MAESAPKLIVVSGEPRIYALLAEEGTITIPAHSCFTTGFVPDWITEYRNPSIFRDPPCQIAGVPPTLNYPNSWTGRYYVGVLIQDSPAGEEPLEIWVGNRLLGHGVAREGDNRVHLLVTPEPVDLLGGEDIWLHFPANSVPYRLESLVLLPRKPEPTPRTLEITDLEVWQHVGPQGRPVTVATWLTNRPALCKVIVRRGRRILERHESKQPLQNHRMELGAAGPYPPSVVVEVTAVSADGTLSAHARSHPELRPPIPARPPVSVHLTVTPRAEGEVQAWPVTVGVPFPQGALADGDTVRLLTSDQRPLPVQTRVLGRWPDGSVRWLLVDTQVDLRGGEETRLRLETQDGSGFVLQEHGERHITVDQTPDGVTVNTGAMRLDIPAQGLLVPGILSLPGSRARTLGSQGRQGILVVDGRGRKYRTEGVPVALAVEDAGPLRAVVRAETLLVNKEEEPLLRLIVRVHAFAGKSWVRVFCTFVNERTASEFTRLRELTLVTGRGAAPFVVAGGQPVPVTIRQLDEREAETNGAPELAADVAVGGLTAETADGVATVAVRHFAENYPKALEVTADAIKVGLCPDIRDRDYAVGGYEEDRLFYYLRDSDYRLKCGVSRTHELFYGVAETSGGAALKREAAWFLRPPAVRPDPGAVLRSGVVGDLAPKDEDRLPAYETYVRESTERYLADRRELRQYGMMNFGDWFGERRYNWGNMEYDTPWIWLLEFLRGGDVRCWDLGEQAAWHLVDVDTCHAHADPNWVGKQYAHCVGHVGGYYPHGYREMATAEGHTSWTHTWVEGLFLYYGLTGHEHIREWAERTCQHLAGAGLNYYDFANCRDCGWLLIHLMAAYSATADRWYLNGARLVVERVLERQRESGGWERLMVPGHCYCDPPRHMGEATFMVGVLLAGLKRYHQATGDPRVRQCLLRGAEYILRENWLPEEKVFRYTNCPHIWASPDMNAQMHEGLAYAVRLSGDEKLYRVLRDCLRRDFSPSLRSEEDKVLVVRVPGVPERRFSVRDEGVGKDISLHMRQAPFALTEVLRRQESLE